MRLSARVSQPALSAPVGANETRLSSSAKTTPSLNSTAQGTIRLIARVNERAVTPTTGLATLYISPHSYLNYPFKAYDNLGTLTLLDPVANPLGHNALGFPNPEIPLVSQGSQDSTVEIDANGHFLRPGATTPAPTVVIPTYRIPQYLSPQSGLPYDLYLANFAVVFQLYDSVSLPVHASIDPARICLFGHGYGATVAYEVYAADPASFSGAALHQGIYYWPSMVGSLTYSPSGGTISATDPALLESSSAIHLATSTQMMYISGEGASTYSLSGPPWITDTITDQLHAWHSHALNQRLLNLGNTSITFNSGWSAQSVYNWIVANV